MYAQLNSAEDELRRSRCRGVLIMKKFLAMMIFIAAMMIGRCGELPTCTRSEILMGTVVTLKVPWRFDYDKIFGDDYCRVRQVVDVHAQ